MEFVRLVEFNSIPMLRLTGDQTAAMIKVAAKPPPERAQMSEFRRGPRQHCKRTIGYGADHAVRQWRQTLDYSNLPKVKAWNVEINANMMQIGARVLQPPQVQYGAGQSQRPNFG
jgi:eukaryotic translation initiation factor 2C